MNQNLYFPVIAYSTIHQSKLCKILVISILFFKLMLHQNLFAFKPPSDPNIFFTINPTSPSSLRQAVPLGASPYSIRGCGNTTVKLEAIATGTGTLKYEWINVINGNSLGNTDIITVPLIEGQYQVKITDDNGSTFSTTIVQLCNDSAPPINAKITSSGATTLCSDGSSSGITLNATAANPNSSAFCNFTDFTYQWLKDNILINGQTSASLVLGNTPNVAGIYSVRISNSCGFSAGSTASVEVKFTDNPPLSVKVISESGSNLICNGGSLNLIADLVGDADSFEWYKQGTINPIATTRSVTITNSGNYKVKAINGCGSNESAFFTVTFTAAPTITTMMVNPDADDLCEAFAPTLSPGVTVGGAPTRYEWYKDGTIVASSDAPFPAGSDYLVSKSGIYKLKTINQCGSLESASRNIKIYPITTDLQIVPQGASALTSTCTPTVSSIVLEAVANTNDLQYQWYKDGFPIDFENNPTLTVTSVGLYTVEIFSNNCFDFLSTDYQVVDVNNAPSGTLTLTSGGMLNTCAGKITLNTNDLGAGVIYQWFKAGNLYKTTSKPMLDVIESANYTVKAKNPCGETALSNALDLTINQTIDNIVLEAPAGVSVCGSSGNILLKIQNFRADLTYQWFKDGQLINGVNTETYQANASGMYKVSATNICNTKISNSIEVKFITAPRYDDVKINYSPCDNPIVLSINTSANFLTYEWYQIVSNTTQLRSNQATFTPNQDGTYVVKVRNQCLGTGVWITSPTVKITIGGGGTTIPQPTITASTDRICPDESALLQVNIPVGGNFNFRWFKENQLIPNQNQASLLVEEAGLYVVEVYAANNVNCSKISSPYSVFIRPNPLLLLSSNGNGTFCEGDSVRLNISASINPAQYQWFRDDNLISNTSSIQAKLAGTYKVIATYNVSILGFPCDTQEELSITLNTLPQPMPDIFKEGDLLKTLLEAKKYQWNFNGIPILSANSPTYLPLDSGRYSLTLTNEIGCVGTSNEIFSKGIYLGFNDLLTISPNPNVGTFYVTVVSESINSISLYNMMGQSMIEERVIDKQNSIGGHTTIKIEGVSTGVYLLKANGDGKFVTKKIIVY